MNEVAAEIARLYSLERLTYSEAIQYLYDLRWFGAKLGLSNTLKLAALAGNPHHQLRFIHVAGTNGKGSTCAMLESIYRTSGLRVGLFTSPHLVAFGERIQVNREQISEQEIIRLVQEMQTLIHQGWGDTTPAANRAARGGSAWLSPASASVAPKSPVEHPTFFEVVTVMALSYFLEQHCDLVIWETGLGGRLDATNIITPLASVITNIQYDHQKWLGETLSSIAAEKAGIIKPGVPVITATDAPEAVEVIQASARENRAPVTVLAKEHPASAFSNGLQLPLLGRHQRVNAALATATARALADTIPVSCAQIRAGLEHVQWPGRLQLLNRSPRQKVLLDGAHNLDGARAVAAALDQHFPNEKPCLILGILADKDWRDMCHVLAPLARRILVVPVSSERTANVSELKAACHAANPSAEVAACNSVAEALEQASQEPFVLVAGSLYLVGEAMELLRMTPHERAGERALNEWSGASSPAPK